VAGGNEHRATGSAGHYFTNGGLVMPPYGTPFGVPIADIAVGCGGIHCITQQQSAV